MMKCCSICKLGDIVEQIRGVSYKPEDLHSTLDPESITLLRANNIQDGQLFFEDIVFVDRKRVKDIQHLKKDDILICISSGSKELVGKAAVVKSDVDATFGAFCKVVRVKRECPQYIACYFDSPTYREKISQSSAGANINNIRGEHIDELEILLPTMQEQHHIAAVIEKVSDLIALRKQQLAKLDELVKARFVEMFGDPITNEKGWPVVPIGEVAEIKIGPFGSLLHKEDYVEGIHALVNPSHIVDDKICVDNKLSVTKEKYEELSAYHLMPGDVVLGRRGEMGRCAVVYREGLLCGTGSMILRADGRIIRPYFLQVILSSPTYKRYIEDKAVGVTMQNLNVPIVSSLLIPLYPSEKQVEYINLLYHIDMEKNTARKSIRALETLKKALMQEYFG